MIPANAQGPVAAVYRTLSDDELEIVMGGAAALQAGVSATQPPSKAPPPIEPAAARQ